MVLVQPIVSLATVAAGLYAVIAVWQYFVDDRDSSSRKRETVINAAAQGDSEDQSLAKQLKRLEAEETEALEALDEEVGELDAEESDLLSLNAHADDYRERLLSLHQRLKRLIDQTDFNNVPDKIRLAHNLSDIISSAESLEQGSGGLIDLKEAYTELIRDEKAILGTIQSSEESLRDEAKDEREKLSSLEDHVADEENLLRQQNDLVEEDRLSAIRTRIGDVEQGDDVIVEEGETVLDDITEDINDALGTENQLGRAQELLNELETYEEEQARIIRSVKDELKRHKEVLAQTGEINPEDINELESSVDQIIAQIYADDQRSDNTLSGKLSDIQDVTDQLSRGERSAMDAINEYLTEATPELLNVWANIAETLRRLDTVIEQHDTHVSDLEERISHQINEHHTN
jgi:chromosome segregation ATPase